MKKYPVKVRWRQGDTVRQWNEEMAWVTEQFGLPGKNWQADVTDQAITIFFNNERDAVAASLKLGGYLWNE
jgi:hypothetical protein